MSAQTFTVVDGTCIRGAARFGMIVPSLVIAFAMVMDCAEPYFRKAIESHERLFGKDRIMIASDLAMLAGVLRERGTPARQKFEEAANRALAICERTPDNDRLLLSSLVLLTQEYEFSGNVQQANKVYGRLIAVFEHTDLQNRESHRKPLLKFVVRVQTTTLCCRFARITLTSFGRSRI